MHEANLAVMVAIGGEPVETFEIIYELYIAWTLLLLYRVRIKEFRTFN